MSADKLGPPRYDFDFEPFDTGLYVLKAKEPDIVVAKERDEDAPPLKGPKNDFNFVIAFVAEGGEMDGRLHYERFPHIMQGHMGLQKLDACMIKMEVIKPPTDPAGHDTAIFDTEDFKKKFKMMVPGRKIVAIIKRSANKRTGTEFSNIVAFYHLNELAQAQADFNKKYVKAGKVKEVIAEAILPGTAVAETPANSDW